MGLIISSGQHVPCSCFTIWEGKVILVGTNCNGTKDTTANSLLWYTHTIMFLLVNSLLWYTHTIMFLLVNSLLWYTHTIMFLLVNSLLWYTHTIMTCYKMSCRHGNQYLDFADTCLHYTPKGTIPIISISTWAQRGYRAPPPPPPMILHEWYHFVQETPQIHDQDVNAL